MQGGVSELTPGAGRFHLGGLKRPTHIRCMSETPPPTAEIIKLPVSPRDKRRAENRFGKKIMAYGYTIVPRLLLHAQARLGVTPAEFNVLLHLLEHWWEADKAPHPAIETIARRMDKSPRQVLRYLGPLEKKGLIKRIHRFRGEKAQTSSFYELDGLVAVLASLEPEFIKAREHRNRRMKKAEAAAGAA